MAELPVTHKIAKALTITAGLPIALLKYLAAEPILTGPLLYLLTRGPPHLRERLLRPFRSNVLARDEISRLSKIVTTLKFLLGIGVATRLNSFLNIWALNGWRLPGLRPKGQAKWVWDGKTEVVVVTGGCSGFGYEMVKLLAGKAIVVVLDVSDLPKELERLPEVHYYKCDLTDYGAISSTSSEVKNRFGNPSVLINNAGIGTGKLILDTTPEALDSIFKVNIISHFILVREFVPGMLEAKKGHVVGIASMASFVAVPGLVDYCVTKIGALYLTEGLRNELLTRYPTGNTIHTTSVHPSWHRTAILKNAEKHLEKHGIIPDPPINVSRAVVEQVLAGRSGRIYMPRLVESQAALRSYPQWFQDLSLGVVSLNPFRTKSFQFGDGL